MDTRSTRSKATFPYPFKLAGYPDELPAGEYDVLFEDELLEGLSFLACRRTAIYLTVRGSGQAAGKTELRQIVESDLRDALVAERRADA